jgi:hypothetical protein
MAAPTEKPFTWRMLQQPDQAPKYQLFPSQRQLPVLNSGKTAEAEKTMATGIAQPIEKHDKPSPAANLRIRINQHNFGRRRKISVPEPGHMTTVQECAMDSRMSTAFHAFIMLTWLQPHCPGAHHCMSALRALPVPP